ncbi:hypothetical protein R3I93_021185, partial [Phoxinus phoxinus]
CAESSSLSHKM